MYGLGPPPIPAMTSDESPNSILCSRAMIAPSSLRTAASRGSANFSNARLTRCGQALKSPSPERRVSTHLDAWLDDSDYVCYVFVVQLGKTLSAVVQARAQLTIE